MGATRTLLRAGLAATAAGVLTACATAPTRAPSTGATRVGPPYQVGGVWYVPREQPDYDQVGLASWYGDAFQFRPTASGELFDMDRVTGAHTTLPLPCLVEVTNLANGRRLQVRVNDRGPFVEGRIIDLSREAARELGFDRQGLARVRVRYLGPAPLLGPEAGVRYASAAPRRTAAPPPAPPPNPAPLMLAAAPAPPSATPLEVVRAMPETLPAYRPAAAPPTALRGYRVQAGAFSDEARARRAAAQLSNVGPAVVEPTARGGLTLYRVLVDGGQDALAADGLRARVAEAGFADARVVRPF